VYDYFWHLSKEAVKKLFMNSLKSLLLKTAEPLKLQLTPQIVDHLIKYCELLIEYNLTTNLTGSKSVHSFIEGPLFDALTLLALYKPVERTVDIGSGGGLPAVPLALLYPETGITMVEPRKKRVEFLKFITARLNIKADIIQTQDRELKTTAFDCAVSQAVFSPEKWIMRAKKIVSDSGAIYVLSSMEITERMLVNRSRIERTAKFVRSFDKADRWVSCIRIGS